MRFKKVKILKALVFIGLFTILSILLMCYANAENKLVFKSNGNNQMKIAITFDDGPHPVNTKEILDVLDKYSFSKLEQDSIKLTQSLINKKDYKLGENLLEIENILIRGIKKNDATYKGK